MADSKEVEIKVVAITELADVESLEDKIDEIKEKAEDDISLDIDTAALESSLEEAQSEVEELEQELANIELGVSDADFSEVSEQLEEARGKAEELEQELDAINNMSVSPTVDTSGIDGAKDSLDETASSADSVTTALAGIGASAAIEQMVTTADNINTSWNRLDLTFSDAGVSMDELKSKASALSDATGRSGGVIRDYFNQMGIAGVTNTDLLGSSFEALAAKSYQTGNSIESMEGRLQRMVMTGQASGMSLQRLGIDAEDLGRAMGVTAEEASKAFKELTPEERLEAITKAMGDGAEANEMYKNSYAGLKDRASAAMAGLAGAVGQAILPVVIPALEAATQFIKLLTDGFKALPGPVQAVIGVIGGVIAVATTVIGVLGMVGKVIGTVKTGLETLGMLGKVTSVISSISGAFSSLWGVLIANPIILVVVAVVALIAALVWAYYNVDWFREMVDNAFQKLREFAAYVWGGLTGAVEWLGQLFNNAGQTIQSSIQGAIDFVMGVLQGLWDYIMTLGGLIPANTEITGNSIVDSVLKVMAFFQTLPLQIGMIFINLIAKALGFGDNFSQNMIQAAFKSVSGFVTQISQLPGRVWSYLSQLVSRALSFASSFVNNLKNGAVNAVNGFINEIKSLPGKLKAEFDAMLAMAQDFVMQIANILTGGGAGMVIGWLTGSGEHSPGFMYDALQGELTAMVGLPLEILSGLIMSISDIGMQMATALSEALFGINFDSVTNSIGWLQSTLMGLWDYIVQLVAMVPTIIQSVAMQVMTSLQQVIAYIATLPGQIAAYLNQVISNAASFASRFVSNVSKAGSDAASQFVSSIKGLASGLASELQNMLSAVDQWAATLPQKFWDAGVNAVKNFLSALGINSPGIMQRTMIWEVSEMAKRIPTEGKYLVENVAGLGDDIVDAFGEPGLNVSFDDTINGRINNAVSGSNQGHVVNLNLEIGSVDNEDRIEEIVEAVRRELAWNNLLAGRTVND